MDAGLGAPLQLRHELRDFERLPVASLLRTAKPALYRACCDVVARAREHAEQDLLGRVERWDAEAAATHAFDPWPVIHAGLRQGFLRMNIPRIFGGGGLGPIASALFAEEIAAADAGVFVIYGAHGLALAIVLASLDLGMALRLGREISEGDRQGRPVLLALAHTEPGGGSDVEDVDDIRHARVASRFTKVPGGYRVNARKVFISNGAHARYNILTACGDPRRPLETMRGFVIPNDAPGMSVGRVEHKLGQRLSSAAEIICEDVFVPDADAIRWTDAGRVIDTTLSLTRGPVGAMSAGIIRGALERTLAYLAEKRVHGRWLFEEQWVQLVLADMLAALQTARGLYMDASFAGEAWGIAKLMESMPEWLPGLVTRSRVFERLVTHPGVIERARARYRAQVPTDQLQRVVAYASIAKFTCSDLAVRVTMRAMEVLGEDANDPRWGVEKCMRDAKLAQIFEGTNQINRLHVTRGLIVRG